MQHETIIERAFSAFAVDLEVAPSITLRSGHEVDSYNPLVPLHPDLDAISDEYLERHYWGIAHLDAGSWRHYIPHLISYALRHRHEDGLVIDSFLGSLRPPDREPPRLGSLSPEQEGVIRAFLDVLAFSEDSANQDLACQTIEEWWIPHPLYRKSPHDV